MAATAREIALLALSACEQQGAWSDGFLKKALREAALDRRDAALATRLCFGVLQNRLLLDFYLANFCTVKPEKMENRIQNLLRLGAYQIIFLTRIPHSAAVNEAVNLARKYSRNPRAAGLVNGVLRALSRSAADLPKPDTGDLIRNTAIRYSHPEWLVREWFALLGEREAVELLEADNADVPTTIQVNTCISNTQALMVRLEREDVQVHVHSWLPDCLTLTGTGNLEQLGSFQEGLFYVQDTAARLAVMAAGPKPGQRVLDACAAPGGKSFAAAIAMCDRGEVVSCDIHVHKERLIRAGAERLGLSCISAQTQNGKVDREEWHGAFDLVMTDVPCSGLGIIRKKPDIRYKDPAPLHSLPAVQKAILENNAQYVRPGGVLLYATCTLRPQENEEVVTWFCGNHTDFILEPFQLPALSGAAETGMLTLWPQRHGTDGFFIAKLRRR